MNGHGVNIDVMKLVASHRVLSAKSSIGAAGYKAASNEPTDLGSTSFDDVLRSRMGDVRFSAHASARLRSRNIEVTPEIMKEICKAVDNAAKKGARDSLVLLNNKAFIINIPNRTVVTAMDGAELKENIFTNIDSAVVAG